MARAIWKGSISFGLVQIPVGLFSAESSEELHFHLLDKRDMEPIRYTRVNAKTKHEVPWSQIVKGYEHAKGEYVVVTDEDFKRANVAASQTIDIVSFVDEGEISPLYFERPYYLAPDKRGEKPYALLRETMRRTRKIGVATVVLRTRQHPAALLVVDDCLVLEILRFGHELRDPADLDLPTLPAEKVVGKRELAMAEQLVSGMASAFDPASLKDTYRDDLVKFIERKAKSGDVEAVNVPAKAPAQGKVVDIMDLLRQSLADGKKGGAKRHTTAAKKTAPVRAKASAKATGRGKAKHRAA